MGHAARKQIIVIGAGIVGASLAYHLARKGAKVTVVEAGEIASGVTGTSFAWINTTCVGVDPIAQLRGAAIPEYRRLEAEVAGLQVRWTGALSFGENPEEKPPVEEEAQTSCKMLSRSQVLGLEPFLKNPPQQAWYAPEQGALDAVAATHALLAAAQAHGAQVLTRTLVSALLTKGKEVTGVQTAAGTLNADMVVLAAGTGITRLVEDFAAHLPIDASPAIFIRYKSQPGLVNTIISSHEMEVRQNADGDLLAAEDYWGDGLEHQAAAVAQRTAIAIQKELAGVGTLESTVACVGLRPIAADRLPVVGHLPHVDGLYVCTMHPGVTLAAVVGRLASEEIVDGLLAPALAPCRPERFSDQQKT